MAAAARKAPEPVMLSLDKIRLDGGTQSRAELNEDTIAEYAEAYAAKVAMPPVIVFHDGESHWLADGFHRCHGARKAERSKIPADVRQGSQRDAILFSVGANDTHGLRRTNADKRRAVLLLLRDEEWGKRGDRWVAQQCGVSHPLVIKLRSEVVTVTTSGKRTGRDGKEYPPTRAAKPAPVVREYPKHGCQFGDGETCPVCADREAKGLTDEPEPVSEPRSVASPPPAPSKWECPECASWWPDDIETCRHCSEADDAATEDDDGMGGWHAHIAMEKTVQSFETMMLEWPRTESLAPVVEWLKTKLAMTEQEAQQWPTK